MADGAGKHDAATWETNFNAEFDRICAAFWRQIAARAEQTQPHTTPTLQLQTATIPSSERGTHLEAPLLSQPNTRGDIRKWEKPGAQDPRKGTDGLSGEAPLTHTHTRVRQSPPRDRMTRPPGASTLSHPAEWVENKHPCSSPDPHGTTYSPKQPTRNWRFSSQYDSIT
ncbi:Hypothetical predicted protein [Pelobates cultripes]|uniref:Uncharacterized protein n=1 Tax=Pelobates cultripes TaxID=61616 RepID=A0AAD1W5H0_PELCU|nr:Hypothetical predicted protein [Pelobates cultripes]